MKKIAPIVLAVAAVALASFACALSNKEASVTNVRMAHDQDGLDVTTTFAPTDVFYVVADLKDAAQGTVIKAKWAVVDVPGIETPPKFPEQSLDITEATDSRTFYFKLSNGVDWPAGSYRVDLYLNDTLTQSLEFNVE
jgi:hypothetical protein